MARKRALPGPLNKIVDTALGAVKDPRAAAEKAFGQAKGTAALGRAVAEGVAGQVVEQVTARTRGRKATDAPHAESPQGHLRPVPDGSAPTAGTATPKAPSAEPPHTAKVAAKKVAKKAPAKKATAKKVAKKAPAKKAPAKKVAKKTPAKNVAAPPAVDTIIEPGREDREAAREASPADVAKVAAPKAAAAKVSPPQSPAANEAPRSDDGRGGAGDKLPPRKSSTPEPAPTPEPNPEAIG